MRDTQGVDKESCPCSCLCSCRRLAHVSPRIWASTSMGRVMSCRAAPNRRYNATNKDQTSKDQNQQ